MATQLAQKVYDAEKVMRSTYEMSQGKSVCVKGKRYDIPADYRFIDEQEIRSFFTTLTYSPWIAMRFGNIQPPRLTLSSTLKKKSYYLSVTQEICLCTKMWSTTKMTVLHEYAHHIVHETGSHVDDDHGKEFVDTYASLLKDHVNNDCSQLFLDLLDC